jgi:TetR/AcrR family transcriptional regulator
MGASPGDEMGAPRSRRTRRWRRRRDEILSAAEGVFAEKGLGAATLEDVAARVELRRASLAYYFRDKDELYEACFARIMAELTARIEASRAERDAIGRMEEIAHSWLDFLAERPQAARIVLRQVVDDIPRRGRATQDALGSMVAAIREAIDAGARRGLFKAIDAGRYAVAIAGASLFWVAARSGVQESLAFDTLSPEHLEEMRHDLVRMTRLLLEMPTAGAGGTQTRSPQRRRSPLRSRPSPEETRR